MTGWGCELHLTQAGTGPWRVPEDNNPFGVFIRTPDVDAIAARVDDLVIRPGGVCVIENGGSMKSGYVDLTGYSSALAGHPG
jgi:hypothetical protein